MPHKKIFLFIYISLLCAFTAQAQDKKIEPDDADSVAFFRGCAVSVDVVGPLMKAFGDYGQYEAQLRVNLLDKYFPVFELGYGNANHEEDFSTGMTAKTKAPYFRIGCDFNIAKHKHDDYRIYGGARYGFTSYKFDLSHPGVKDPVWGDVAYYGASEKCNAHWLEAVFGVDAKIAGPFRLGWSFRYRRKIAGNDGSLGNTWYIPGYGKNGSSVLGGSFNLIFEI